jgi:putative membrane-bound dehydrogenase-like protein
MRYFISLFSLGFLPLLAGQAPVRALLVCGGCCHDYEQQAIILRDGIQARANVQVDVIRNEEKGTRPYFPMYEGKDWAAGYDVIIHDECAADIKDVAYVRNIVGAHKNGLPAVNLHCAMHSYRTGTDLWFEFLGLQSSGHGAQLPIAIDFKNAGHPVTKGVANWTTIGEELYNNVQIFDSATPLAIGSQKQKDGKTETAVVAWTNNYHGTRIFNTTLGHNNETVSDERYLDLVARGVLWSCGMLDEAHLQPYIGPKGHFDVISNHVPGDTSATASEGKKQASDDPFSSGGNIRPHITRLSPDREAEILKDVKVADGFDVSLFSASSSANYPVYVAASPAGDLYVSSDGNGSIGRDPKRGRILRLRDVDHDGRADEVTEFVKDVDSPRGLVWDHDRLYLIHPPDVSCYIDHDGDGQADEEKTLIKGIAFGFKDRPADHTTNGLTMGIDGWLYIAGGDFGFMDAVGTDGRRLLHRGGGVIRFRPDGSGLELFSDGTRNILGTPISPLMDIFARDNTNDGGGWDIRFHHFTGLENHGYPRLYMNFGDEIIKPLADYGGGSGCGSVYISEPGFPKKWNDAPYTCDWGSGSLWHHTVVPEGATFKESEKPESLVKMTRPTDADVDGMSAIYQASWKGATFKWQGPDVGYIVRVVPKGYVPEPLPDFENARDIDLVKILESLSQVRVLEAQRTLLRRRVEAGNARDRELFALAGDETKDLKARVAALYCLTQGLVGASGDEPLITSVGGLAKDPKLASHVLRALSDAGLAQLTEGKTFAPVAIYDAGLRSEQSRTRLEAIIGATRQNIIGLAPRITSLLGDVDPVIDHTAFQSLSILKAADACFNVVDSKESTFDQRVGALRALMRMHSPEVVQGLISRLTATKEAAPRADLLAALCRLYFKEGEWKGDSWGTRPDTRGPYYQPEPWSETPKIAIVLKAELGRVSPAEAPAFINELKRNRIEFNETLDRVLALVKEKPEMLPDLVDLLAGVETIPSEGVSFLIDAAKGAWPSGTLAQAVKILAKIDSNDGCMASLAALAALENMEKPGKDFKATMTAFLTAPKLENQHQLLEDEAARMNGAISRWADAGLLALGARKGGSPESIELSRKAIDLGWKNPERRIQILGAIQATGFHGMDDKVRNAMTDGDAAVAKAAVAAAKILKIKAKEDDKTPVVGTLKPEEVIAEIIKTRGDVSLGEQMFTRQTCSTCHASSLDQVQKGPYLGNIAQTYGRGELAANILDPQKTIAQGFATEMFTLKDGTQQMGFVSLESTGQVKARDLSGKEHEWKTGDITKREKLPISMMPPGLASNMTVFEFASLLDYLESLSKK